MNHADERRLAHSPRLAPFGRSKRLALKAIRRGAPRSALVAVPVEMVALRAA